MTGCIRPGLAPRRQLGVTLIELLISLALGLAVLVGLSAVYVAAKQSFRYQETSGRLQEDASYALDAIAKDLRMTGFAGCRGVDAVTVSGTTTYYPTLGLTTAPTAITGPNPLATVVSADAMVTFKPLSPANIVRGFDATVPSAMFAVGSVPTSGTTDSLYFTGGSMNAVSVTAAMSTATDALTIGTDSQSWGTSAAYHMVVSDCNNSSFFVGQLATSGGVTSIQHTTANGNAAATFPGSAIYGVDAIVMPVEWTFYYVATRTGASTPSLYRVTYDGTSRKTPEEIVSNVETMKLHYGENTANDGSGAPTMQANVWRTTAAAVTDWSRVVAVRIGLMMVSSESGVMGDVVSSPTLLGSAYTVPTAAATRVHKEFSTTVVLRNRIAPR